MKKITKLFIAVMLLFVTTNNVTAQVTPCSPLSSSGNIIPQFDMSGFNGWFDYYPLGNGATKVIENTDTEACEDYAVFTKGTGNNWGAGSVGLGKFNNPWDANTQYRLRVWIKTVNGNVKLGVYRIGTGAIFDGETLTVESKTMEIDTKGAWQLIDYTFTTGANPNSPDPGAFAITTQGVTGTVAEKFYLDNFELYDLSATTLGVNDKNVASTAFKLYPNPSTDNSFNIELSNGYTKSITSVKIYNVLGNLVLDKKVNANDKSITIDHNLKSGVYFVNVANKTTKLIVE